MEGNAVTGSGAWDRGTFGAVGTLPAVPPLNVWMATACLGGPLTHHAPRRTVVAGSPPGLAFVTSPQHRWGSSPSPSLGVLPCVAGVLSLRRTDVGGGQFSAVPSSAPGLRPPLALPHWWQPQTSANVAGHPLGGRYRMAQVRTAAHATRRGVCETETGG